jgi:hypothetical protein
MRTEILVNWTPNRGRIKLIDVNATFQSQDATLHDDNRNYSTSDQRIKYTRTKSETIKLDLRDDLDFTLNFTVFDVREPEKRKTNYSKTITLPGTKKNRKIFGHIYEISGDTKINPNIKMDVLILQDGLEIMRGNLQLVNITPENEFEVIITGKFMSIFNDLGQKKIRDLVGFDKYRHFWTKEHIENSWNGIYKVDGKWTTTSAVVYQFTSVGLDSTTGRVKITTTTTHNLSEGDWVRITPNEVTGSTLTRSYIKGDFQVAEAPTSTSVIINYQFPDGLIGNTQGGTIKKFNQTGKGYVYPLISWGEESANTANFPVTSFIPSFYIKEIFDEIFKELNYKYDSQFLNSNFFSRLILTQKKPVYDIPSQLIQSRKFKVGNSTQPSIVVAGFGTNNTGGYTSWRSFPQNTTGSENFPLTDPVIGSLWSNGSVSEKPYDQVSNKWNVNYTGRYTFKFTCTIDSILEASTYTTTNAPLALNSAYTYYPGGAYSAGSLDKVTVQASLILKRRGLETTLDNKVVTFGVKGKSRDSSSQDIFKDSYYQWRWVANNIEFSKTNYALDRGDEIYIKLKYKGQFNNDQYGLFVEYNPSTGGQIARRGIWQVRIISVAVFSNEPSIAQGEGSEVIPAAFLPTDLTCVDFLIAMIRMFNLHWESDKDIDRLYYIEPRDDYYKDGSGGESDYIDWTDKVDVDTISKVPMGQLTAKRYSFEYKDENDFLNKRYLEETGRKWGNHTQEIQNDFLTNEKKITLPFGSTVMTNLRLTSDTEIILPQVVQRDNNGAPKPTTSAPKILIWGGIRPTSTNGSPVTWTLKSEVEGGSGTYTYYPYAGTVDSPRDPIWDLNWYYTDYVYWNHGRWTNQNLYLKYWNRFIDEISDKDSKLIKAYLNLLPKDINSLDFKKIYLIDGHYLRLQKIIDYNSNGWEKTECEFLKLKSPSKFKPISTYIDDDDTTWGPTGGPKPWDDASNTPYTPGGSPGGPPKNPPVRPEFSNITSEELSTTTTIKVTGKSNIISAAAENISIQGDECFIGNGAENITISGGNGVFISGGLKNVNIIGTNKIIVDESDVTYINGIRYKAGVAISRSNVIDGGLNAAFNKSAINTTVNVIDSCEDIVIRSGSNSPENVVEGGSDRILPDIPTYGISTLNNSSPDTNATGGAISTSTEPLAQTIEATIQPQPYSAGLLGY